MKAEFFTLNKSVKTINWRITMDHGGRIQSRATVLINTNPLKKSLVLHEWTIKATWGSSQMFGLSWSHHCPLNKCVHGLSVNLNSLLNCHMEYKSASDPQLRASLCFIGKKEFFSYVPELRHSDEETSPFLFSFFHPCTHTMKIPSLICECVYNSIDQAYIWRRNQSLVCV